MPFFPLFVDLNGQHCVVVGGGPVAARKMQALSDFGAKVLVLTTKASEEVHSLSRLARIILKERPYGGPEDLAGASLVISATDNRELNARIAQDAKDAGIPVNIADDPELCTFFFPALVRRGDLIAGISTSGACPRLAARLRERLDEAWSPDLGKSLELLKEQRHRLKKTKNTASIVEELDRLISEILEEQTH
ncbi:siroheme synthase [Treponema primitia ZAS-2]|uniref:precorrin-2 dehydrogenase n=1 Tax=Treponema primitia (strain ATCC BAA-887 / DSM 12427 / ZAS-2) TaxID=545694 RepID=F5YLI7_TREPZ|nr:bifunctional precorrin-2 dehydrogenase/sirohydrochlorin ferrochelatase [Treponema primitia]AEF84001.1 siroheme synthase [Treponema primitia ZAS-2]